MEAYTRGVLGPVLFNDEDITNNGWTMQVGVKGEFLQVYSATIILCLVLINTSSCTHLKELIWCHGTVNPNNPTIIL